jgi:hypothetical protein
MITSAASARDSDACLISSQLIIIDTVVLRMLLLATLVNYIRVHRVHGRAA